MRLLILILGLSTAACSHTPTEKETYREGIREGFAMGHAPQILPIQILPVSLNAPTSARGAPLPPAAITIKEDDEATIAKYFFEGYEAATKQREAGE